MRERKTHRLTYITTAAAVLAAAGCARHTTNGGLGHLSSGEKQVLNENPFSAESQIGGSHVGTGNRDTATPPTFDPTTAMTGIEGEQISTEGQYFWNDDDSPWPVNEPAVGPNACPMEQDVIKRCDPASYEAELQSAMKVAAADPTHQTVVVRYAYSFGTPFDEVAHDAYMRSILKHNDDGITPVPVAPSDTIDPEYFQGDKAFHYYADHKQARADYIHGDKCFFTTVKMVGRKNGPVLADSTRDNDHELPSSASKNLSYNHSLNILYYGDAYTTCASVSDTGDCTRRYLSPRLFKHVEDVSADYEQTLADWANPRKNPTELALSDYIRQCITDHQAQILPLYVADIREQRINIAALSGVLINRDFSSSATRRYEYEVKGKKILDLPALWYNREAIESSFWRPADLAGFHWDSYEGVAQLLDNLIFSGTNGTVLSTQYTPIVLDLPIGDNADEYEWNKHIHTSSATWGTFFNLANLSYKDANGQSRDIHHLTAWVGGPMQLTQPTDAVVPDQTGDLHWRRIATDGFLVMPEVRKDSSGKALACSDGTPAYSVPRGENMFGSYARVKGQIQQYANGFQNLRDWINRSGTSYPKSCAPLTGPHAMTKDQMKARYFGPWDGAAYGQLMIWLDRNRDGRVDCGEMMSLEKAKIAAFNTCDIVYNTDSNGELVPAKDKYGNSTYNRAAFLVADSPNATMSDDEIYTRLTTGKKTTGASAEFRVAIDILFNTRTDVYLEDVDPSQITAPLVGTQNRAPADGGKSAVTLGAKK